jgi:6-hydroxycyclohex-1-ene-1-carbonyl-CoA dehydrogenase
MTEIVRWLMTAQGAPLERAVSEAPEPGAGQALIEVAGCGVCHTDLGFLWEGVRTRAPLPLALGHEVAGFVRAAGAGAEDLVGQAVVVPAVLPCGDCADCAAGRGTVCKQQFMPGNDGHGGFATHLVVPARGLCLVPDCDDADQELGQPGLTLRTLSVLADAASTAYQAVIRAQIPKGGAVAVVGAGGVGIYAVQLAKHFGARVVALDVDPERREQALAMGADLVLDAAADRRTVRGEVRSFLKGSNGGVRVFECSGHPSGQELSFDLLGPAGVLLVVGYTSQKVTIRLSRLMALDAQAIGNWGCLPEHYPPLLELVRSGAVQVAPLCKTFPLDDVQEVLEAVRGHAIRQRPVLVP